MTNPTITREEYLVATGQKVKSAPATRGRGRGAAKRTEVDGIVFQSKKEASRYLVLLLEQKHKRIMNLRLQVPFSLAINRIHITIYKADFVYIRDGVEVVEDAKGYREEVYRLKKKLMLAIHGIEIQEV